MKNLKRVLFSFLIVIILIPQITFASWWNPFSWKIFNHKVDQSPSISLINENKELNYIQSADNSSEEIEKLKKQIEDLQNKQTDIPVKNIETKKVTSTVDNSELIKKQVQEQLEAKLKAQKEKEALVVVDQEEENVDGPDFEVIAVRQTIFENPSYGGFEIEIMVTANEEKIYIPKTTTDSTKAITGFTYSIKGDAFRGNQNSEVNCSTSTTIKSIEYCSIGIGKSSDITTTVWLTPNESGNYGLLFEDINYLYGENHLSGAFNINEVTQKIYVR